MTQAFCNFREPVEFTAQNLSMKLGSIRKLINSFGEYVVFNNDQQIFTVGAILNKHLSTYYEHVHVFILENH